MAESILTPIEIGLTAAIVAVEDGEPAILVAQDVETRSRAGLPFGPFDPLAHRTFEIGLRAWVEAQTALRDAGRGGRRRRGAARRARGRVVAPNAPGPRRADALRPSPHPRDRDRTAAREAQISPRRVRADARRVYAHGAAANRRGDLGPAP